MKSQIFEANASSTISLVGMGLVIVAGAGAGGFTEADCRAILLGLSFAESKVDWSKNIQKCFTNIRAVKKVIICIYHNNISSSCSGYLSLRVK